MGQWNQAEQAREAATQILHSIGNLEKEIGNLEREITRLQEQQKKDDERFCGLKEDVVVIQKIIRELESKVKDFEKLLERIQFIEMKLSTFWADGVEEFVTHKDFIDYQEEIAIKAERLQLAVETEKAKAAVAQAHKMKTIRMQWGAIAVGALVAGGSYLPQIWQALTWLIQKVIDG